MGWKEIFLFQVENGLDGLDGKKLKYRISIALWYATDFPHSFAVCLAGLLSKNYWDDLDIIDQGHGKGNI